MRSFISKLVFNSKYFSLWVAYFILARLLFITYYFEQTSNLDFITCIQLFLYGLKLDFSFAAYLSAIPFLVVVFSIWIPQNLFKKLIKAYTFIAIFFISALMVLDLGLYGPWGIRLDSTPLIYLNTPKEMLASLSFKDLIFAVSLWISWSLFCLFFAVKIINKATQNSFKGSLWQSPFLLIITSFLVLIMRGGLQTIPINQSNVYFSNQMFANHAAINFAWNFLHSISTQAYTTENPFKLLSEKEASSVIETAREPLCHFDAANSTILTSDKPNVILIIWESLTAKVVTPLGGREGVTEHFNQLCKEGLLFTNFYANGDRSDKGLVAILSGYYPQPHKSIIKNPSKSRSLPILSQDMSNLGYHNSFYYGGDLNFGNMNTYLRNGGITHFVDGDDFTEDQWNSKWGAHDHILLNRLLEDLNQEEGTPFFKTVFTLSSHEPFEFPDEYKFGKKGKTNKFLSSLAYTDKALGYFIAQAKKQDWWQNTLVVIMADHGHPLPKQKGVFNKPSKFHIPMLWLGGALNKTGINSNICSQKDFAYSLLPLLNGDNSSYTWGKNIFSSSKDDFAHYIFNKGFGTINTTGHVVYDYVNQKEISVLGDSTKHLTQLGKAITQNAYKDYIER